MPRAIKPGRQRVWARLDRPGIGSQAEIQHTQLGVVAQQQVFRFDVAVQICRRCSRPTARNNCSAMDCHCAKGNGPVLEQFGRGLALGIRRITQYKC